MDCALCHKPITSADKAEGTERYEKREVHADCYYEAISDVIEKDPPINPRIRRG